eukprot:Clim_evm69s218 gene=Clim_evmTU69s218
MVGRCGNPTPLGDFRDGQIVRIKLKNITVYREAQFYPQPKLNLVIGPNGAGKSSVVSAMVLALGYSIDVIKRKSINMQAKDFVRSGERKAVIEFDIRDSSQRKGILAITCTIDQSNKMVYTMNGSQCTKRAVKEARYRLNIDMDNLCQCLPQEKVSEFTRQKPHELLRSTQTALEPDLLDKQRHLADVAAQNNANAGSLKGMEERIRALERRLESLAVHVQRAERLDDLREQVKWLHLHATYLTLSQSKDRYDQAVEEYQHFEQNYKDIEEQLAPLREAVALAEQEYHTIHETWREANRRRQKAGADARAKANKVEQVESETQIIRSDLETSELRKRKLKSNIDQTEKNISQIEDKLANAPDPEPMMPEYQAKKQEVTQYQSERNEIKTQGAQISNELANLRNRHQRLARDYKDADNAQEQRIRLLRSIRAFEQTTRAIDMYRERFADGSRLRGKVFLPLAVELNVDGPMAAMVESAVAIRHLQSFVCTDTRDRDLLLTEIRERSQIPINILMAPNTAEWNDWQSKNRKELSQEEIEALGFDTTLARSMTAAGDVIKTLIVRCNISNILIKKTDIDMATVDRLAPRLIENGCKHFYAPGISVKMKKSVVDDAIQHTFAYTRRAQFLHQSVDREQLKRCKGALDRSLEGIQAKETEHTMCLEQEREIDAKLEPLNADLRSMTKTINQRRTLQQDLQRLQDTLASHKNSFADADRQEQSLRRKLVEALPNKLEAVDAAVKAHEAEVTAIESAAMTALEMEQLNSRRVVLSNRLREMEAEHGTTAQVRESFRSNMEEAKRVFRSQKRSLRELLREHEVSEERIAGLPDEDPVKFRPDVEEANRQYRRVSNELEHIQQPNQERIREHQQVETDLAAVRQQLEEARASNENSEAEFEAAKREWLEPMQAHIDGINEDFRRFFISINCNGSVRLNMSNRDVMMWGIEIMVRFRNSEPEQALNAGTHSGGERTVSTMLYLLALQRQISCPFRLVDEINQGMDPDNERAVFQKVMEVSSSAESRSQTFVITPKLLPNLITDRNHDTPGIEDMALHCIFNGDYIPSYQEFDFDNYINTAA